MRYPDYDSVLGMFAVRCLCLRLLPLGLSSVMASLRPLPRETLYCSLTAVSVQARKVTEVRFPFSKKRFS